jgi:hypothetical protein
MLLCLKGKLEMGHNIRALIGMSDKIEKFSNNWSQSANKELEQGFALVKVTDELLDDINELSSIQSSDPYEEFDFLSSSLNELLMQESFRTQIAYIETDYFGGIGTQVVVLYDDGKVTVGPLTTEDLWDQKTNTYVQKTEGIRAINQVLKKVGVWCKKDVDEFDSLGLAHHRTMEST